MYLDQKKIKGENLDISKFYNSDIPNYNVDIKNKIDYNKPKTYRFDNVNFNASSVCQDIVHCNSTINLSNNEVKLGVYALPSSCYGNVVQCSNKMVDSENNFRMQLMGTLLWKQADRYMGVSEPKFIF